MPFPGSARAGRTGYAITLQLPSQSMGRELHPFNKWPRLSFACLERVRHHTVSQSLTPRAILSLPLGLLQG